MTNTIKLWHGGRNLQHSYNEYKGSGKGRWEHGPGLYLTTHYETARKYAKGGGTTYMVEVEEGNDIDNILLPIEKVNEFIVKNIIKSKQKNLIEDIYNNMHRLKSNTHIKANYFLNLVFNLEAISSSKTAYLNSFLVENNVDYGLVKRFSGRDETLLVVFNNQKIKSVKSIHANEVNLSQYELPFEFMSSSPKMKI